MLLTFAAPNGAWQDPGTARLRPGHGGARRACTTTRPAAAARAHRHPARRPGARRAARPADGVDALLTQWSAALEQDPWLTTWPVLLAGTPVPPGPHGVPGSGGTGAGGPGGTPVRARSAGPGPSSPAGQGKRWHLVDGAGAALPLADRESLWTLLAVSGGQPVTVAGEWHPDGLVALTTWHGDQAVTL